MDKITETHELKQTKSGIINYRGCLVDILIGGYEVFGLKVLTPEEVDKVIDDACLVIENSIKK